MKRSGHLLCTFGLNRVLQFVVLMSVCWTYQDSRVEATTTCDCADCVSYCTAGWALAKYCGITGARYEGGVGSGQPSRGVYCVSNCTGLGEGGVVTVLRREGGCFVVCPTVLGREGVVVQG
ncbi:hypothetical protein Bbelb_380030 [Branchiostoma belcheri]|nr:hypothetical protein Bbelb_380030 [Branchiostoma belcheri]